MREDLEKYTNPVEFSFCGKPLINLFASFLLCQIYSNRVRVRSLEKQKRKPAQPEWPRQDRKIFRQCMGINPHKPQLPSEDKVAVL